MKLCKNLCLFAVINIIIVGIFASYLKVGGNDLSLVEILFKSENGFALLFIINILIFLIPTILLLFDIKKSWIDTLIFVLFIGASIMFIFSKNIYFLANQKTTQKVTISVIPVVFSIISLFLSMYEFEHFFSNKSLSIRDIVEISIFVCFAVVLDFPIFKFKIGATGGSISLVMVPLIIVCLRKGFLKGFFACGIVYGLLNCLMDGYGFMFYPFDYLLGFGSMAFVGLFRSLILTSKKKFYQISWLVLAVLIALIGRTLAATLSGIIFYNMNFVSSLIYQLTYIGPSGAICFAVVVVLFSSIKRLTPVLDNK